MSAEGAHSGPPTLDWHDHQSSQSIDLSRLDDVVRAALPLILASPGPAASHWLNLPEVEISILDDGEMARLHGEFMGDPTTTDVITFHHGEILVSADTAEREAAARGQPLLRELSLYVIHGLLHLHGHTDADDAPRAAMHQVQERILDAVWPPA